MSGKKHSKGDMNHPRGGSIKQNPGIYTGSKYVKKANMTITYTNYNKTNQPDKQEWS